MTVTPSTLIPAASEAEAHELWTPAALPLPNWGSPITVTTAYRTVVEAARSAAEQRYGLTTKPVRSMTFNLRGYGQDDTERVRHLLARMARARTPMPLYPDVTRLTGKPNLTANTYTGDFSNRRFQVGARIVAVRENRHGIATDFQFRTVTGLTSSTITLDGNLGETYTVPPTIKDHLDEEVYYEVAQTTLNAASRDIEVQVGDVVICSVSYAYVDGSQPVTEVSGLSTINSEGQTEDHFGDLVGQGNVVPLPSRVHQAVAAWRNDRNQVMRPVWEFESPGIGLRIYRTLTVVRGAHFTDPFADTQFVSGDDAFNAPRNIGLTWTHDISIPAQLGLVYHTSASPTNPGGFYAASPDPPVSLLDSGRDETRMQVATTQADLSAEGTTLLQEALTVEAPEDAFALAGGVLLNPAEDGLARDYIYPVIEGDVEFEQIANVLTDQISDGSITIFETQGASALDPSVASGSNPPGRPTSSSIPILDLPIDWSDVKIGAYRMGNRTKTGLSNTVQVFGDRPGATFTLPFLTNSRAEHRALLEFFDSRGGRLHPFWLLSPASGINVDSIGVNGDTLFFDVRGTERDWEVYKHIGVIDANGTRTIRTITNSVESGGQQVIVISPPLPTDDPSDYAFQTAHLCRFDTDELQEEWITDEDSRTSLAVKEIIDEKTVTVDLVQVCSGAGGIDEWEPNSEYDPCHADRCGVTDPEGCCMCGLYGLTVTTFRYAGAGLGAGDPECADGCELQGSCSAYLNFVSCIGNTARWENTSLNMWVTLNTATGDWSYDLGDLILGEECVPEVTEPLIECAGTDFCEGEPNPVVTSSCSSYTVEYICDRYNPAGTCGYIVTLQITALGGEEGSELCA